MTACVPREQPRPTGTTTRHEHAWLVRSSHPTSDGLVVYVSCSACDARRVDIQDRPDAPPSAISTVVHVGQPSQ